MAGAGIPRAVPRHTAGTMLSWHFGISSWLSRLLSLIVGNRSSFSSRISDHVTLDVG